MILKTWDGFSSTNSKRKPDANHVNPVTIGSRCQTRKDKHIVLGLFSFKPFFGLLTLPSLAPTYFLLFTDGNRFFAFVF